MSVVIDDEWWFQYEVCLFEFLFVWEWIEMIVIDCTPIPYSSTQTIHNTSYSISNHYDLNMNCVSSVIIYHSIYHVFIIIQSLSSIQFIHSINTYSQHTLNYLHSLRDDIVMKIIKRDCLESVLMRCEEGVYWLIWCEDGVKI